MKVTENVSLAPYTSLRVGGAAHKLIECSSYKEALETIQHLPQDEPFHILGFGSNSLISDKGLTGTTILWREGEITHDGTTLIADAGAWWDDVVTYAIGQKLWGLELTSEIPSSVGGAVFGNIAAYGQQVSDTLLWVDVFNRRSSTVERLFKTDLSFSYRSSSLQATPHLLILRVAFKLARARLHELRYESALMVAGELDLSLENLDGIRKTIIETRRRAGSLYHFDDKDAQRTAGSFFKNPLVSLDQAKTLATYDESGKTLERILEQNSIHGGSSHRVSAAHVLLAAGFNRGQRWKNVRLHPDHVLKIETLPGASAQEVYEVTREIIVTVQEKLQITLQPEVRFLGNFS